MDTPSHGLWSYVLWHSAAFPFLAVLFGMLPDIVSFIPATIYNLAVKRKLRAGLRQKEHPRWLRAYTEFAFPIMHSLLVALTVSAAVLLISPRQLWVLAWPLHILVDVFSHAGEHRTPFLWPLFSYRYNGVNWSVRLAAVNILLLAVAWVKFVH